MLRGEHARTLMQGGQALALVLATSLSTSVVAQQRPAAVPPPPGQNFANCSRPVYAVDHLVCDSAELRAADASLRERLATLQPDFAAPWFEDQYSWFRRRAMCASQPAERSCVVEAYRERTSILDALSVLVRASRPLGCDRSDVASLSFQHDAAVIADRGGRPIAVAFPTKAYRSWRPFASFTIKGRKLVVQTIDNYRLTCTLGRNS